MNKTQVVGDVRSSAVAGSSERRPSRLLGWAGVTSRALPDTWRPDVDELRRPPRPSPYRELGGVVAGLRLPGALPRLAGAPRGDGHVVVDVPGWRAPEVVGLPQRRYLRLLGYDARGWGLGVNTGRPERDAELLSGEVLRLAETSGRPVSLLGWSLGGLIVREVARRHPEVVRRVVTYGTPVVGGPSWTAGASAWSPEETARIAALIAQLDQEQPIQVPLTAVYTRRDAIVSPAACIDLASPQAEHVRVRSTHLGLVADPDVWSVVAHRLALP
ncbi:esterase/lipase family protein [Modestobacter sp. VKM Ac-2985]|uniref:esterase/lipase family protein n=1 Tax=Modestobacter sp. VKM Ac-2985 TaxID=3004139 RepID=UPI0022ABB4A9|nr:alpha/beta fold hydrolase [Modestobacter sp. VKM Ac-2985]MCZ2839591.1 alpha/beta fold hydrolase [Modestobacter sp. VKM Ac-2985]